MRTVKIEATIQPHPAADADTTKAVAGFAASELERLSEYFARDGHILKFEVAVTGSAVEGDGTD